MLCGLRVEEEHFPADKANLNLEETSLWEHHSMSLQDSRKVESHPKVSLTNARSPQL